MHSQEDKIQVCSRSIHKRLPFNNSSFVNDDHYAKKSISFSQNNPKTVKNTLGDFMEQILIRMKK